MATLHSRFANGLSYRPWGWPLPFEPASSLHRGTRVACAALWRPPIRVLIAEDDPDIRKLVEDVIAGLGHATCCAGNGAEALGNSAYTYFILLTALGDADHRLAGIQAGADDYIAKPFSLDDIEARMVAAERVTVVHRRQEALLHRGALPELARSVPSVLATPHQFFP